MNACDTSNHSVALREIADDVIDYDELEESLIKGLQKFVEKDDPEEDEVDLIAIQQELHSEDGAAPQASAYNARNKALSYSLNVMPKQLLPKYGSKSITRFKLPRL